jgi:hypothetical protein
MEAGTRAGLVWSRDLQRVAAKDHLARRSGGVGVGVDCRK